MAFDYRTESRRFSRYYTTLEPILARPLVRAYSVLVLSFFALAFFGYFAIKPTLITIVTLRRQIRDARFVDQKLQEKINALSVASTNYEMIKPDLDLVMAALPQEVRFAQAIKTIERIATESGVIISGLNFQTANLSSPPTTGTTKESKETAIGFNLTIGGNYLNLSDFLKRLTFHERLFTVERMELSNKKEEGLRFVLTGQTYFFQ